MIVNEDVLAISRAVDQLSKVSEEIGRTTEQIENVEEEQYLATLQGIDDPTYQYQIDNLRCHRDDLDIDKSKARTDVYEKFEHYYS
ncbi:MAG TPA: hypothetical protein H9820_05480 [Candidatus Companilactobacillus pullicola]|uniref:Uncharacterized protein n=1 Tax=Candidatus Companilactobacillus pullicola TaxID=2838523 RepID=A0A9D1ZMP5_9LACO|nr:hypothetical protein [Candidatus Companilactobacillus pullicola]